MGKYDRQPLVPDRGVPGPDRYRLKDGMGDGKRYVINPKRKNFDPAVTDYTNAPGPKYTPNLESVKKYSGAYK